VTFFTWLSLFILLVLYPAFSLIGVVGTDTAAMLRNLTSGMLMFMLIVTVLMQWGIFTINYASLVTEETGLKGIGVRKLTPLDLAWAVAFWLAALLTLTGLSWVMAKAGLEIPSEIEFLIPKDFKGRILWVVVSVTAGFCEEVAFRGYLMTRLRLLTKSNSWVIPTIVSSLVFGICHSYQGIAGFILISIYGVLFSLLYIRTGSLWPGIIAHFFQDVMYIFFPSP
jgi:hypothetical protein